MKHQSLREIFTITEYKDGCVYRTKSTGLAFVTLDLAPPKDTIFSALSTKLSSKLKVSQMFRKVTDDIPDIVRVNESEL